MGDFNRNGEWEWTTFQEGPTADLRLLKKNQCVVANPEKNRWDVYTRIGKKAAGRLLDGSEWNEFPEATP